MPHLARHFIEEYLHGDIYRKGLQSLFPDELVLHAQPLPSTRALVNFLSETAARSSFAYYAGNEVLQLTENTSDGAVSGSIDDFYAAMRRHYPWSDRLVASFIAHTHADQKLGHENVFKEMCDSIPPLSRRRGEGRAQRGQADDRAPPALHGRHRPPLRREPHRPARCPATSSRSRTLLDDAALARLGYDAEDLRRAARPRREGADGRRRHPARPRPLRLPRRVAERLPDPLGARVAAERADHLHRRRRAGLRPPGVAARA